MLRLLQFFRHDSRAALFRIEAAAEVEQSQPAEPAKVKAPASLEPAPGTASWLSAVGARVLALAEAWGLPEALTRAAFHEVMLAPALPLGCTDAQERC